MSKEATARSAMKLALEALEGWGKGFPDNWGDLDTEAVTALREALAEQPKESPKFDPNESFAREEAAQARVHEFMRNH